MISEGNYLNTKRLYRECRKYQRMTGHSTYNDCGTRALAMVAHTPYWEAMSLLRGHRKIWPPLKKKGCNGFKFVKLNYGYISAKKFAEDHPNGRFILYHGEGRSHHYVPCVHGQFWNDSGGPVTQIYQAIPE